LNINSFIKKARMYQDTLLFNHRLKKQVRQRSYRVFLQRNTGYLPSIPCLLRWRTTLLAMSLGCIGVTSLFVFIDYPRFILYDIIILGPDLEGITSIPILMGSGFIILFSFSMMIDFVVYRRGGHGMFIN